MTVTHVELAEELEQFAVLVVELPGVSRINPHEFAEAKSELAARIRRRAVELRQGIARRQAAALRQAGAIVPGARIVGQRQVLVEVRRGAR